MPKTELLSRGEEVRLIASAQSGDNRAMEQLLAANTGLVADLVKHYLPVAGRLEAEDLMQAGRIGFVHAVRRFDATRDCRLSTSAWTWIRQAIRREIDTYGRTIHAPIHAQEKGLPEPVSLDEIVGEDGGTRLSDLLAGDPGPEATIVNDLGTDAVLCPLLDALTEKERRVIELRFGLGGRGELSLQEAGRVAGLSREGTRLVQDRALRKMRGRAKIGLA